MTGLLVSVRSAAEAAIVVKAGVQVLDVKEPARGSLGRADLGVLDDVFAVVAGRLPVSAALGELAEWVLPAQGAGERRQEAVPAALAFAKLGLAGCGSWRHWPDAWADVMATWPETVARVAVAYADWEAASAPRPEEVLECGCDLGCRAALLDTYDKRCGGLFDHLPESQVAAWIEQARQSNMLAVVAGSLNAQTAGQAAALGPDLIAVRGAVCRGGREGKLDARRIGSLRERIAKTRPRSESVAQLSLRSPC